MVHTSQVFKPTDVQVSIMQQAVEQGAKLKASQNYSVVKHQPLKSEEQLVLGRIKVKIRDGLNNAKQANANFNYFEPLNDMQQRNLEFIGIQGVRLGNYILLTVPQEYKSELSENLNNLLLKGEAAWNRKASSTATEIQRIYKGYHVRLLFPQYKEAKGQYDAANSNLNLPKKN